MSEFYSKTPPTEPGWYWVSRDYRGMIEELTARRSSANKVLGLNECWLLHDVSWSDEEMLANGYEFGPKVPNAAEMDDIIHCKGMMDCFAKYFFNHNRTMEFTHLHSTRNTEKKTASGVMTLRDTESYELLDVAFVSQTRKQGDGTPGFMDAVEEVLAITLTETLTSGHQRRVSSLECDLAASNRIVEELKKRVADLDRRNADFERIYSVDTKLMNQQ